MISAMLSARLFMSSWFKYAIFEVSIFLHFKVQQLTGKLEFPGGPGYSAGRGGEGLTGNFFFLFGLQTGQTLLWEGTL